MTDAEKIARLRDAASRRQEAALSSAGIPRGFRRTALIYNEATQTLVTSVERDTAGSFERKIYIRGVHAKEYQELATPSTEIHFSDVVTSPARPFIYYRATRVQPGSAPGEFEGYWVSVERFDIASAERKTVATAETLRLPHPYQSGCISGLHGVSYSDDILFSTCALQQPNDGRVHHWLSALETGTREILLLSHLEATWF